MWHSWWFVVLFVAACAMHVMLLSPEDAGPWNTLAFAAVALTFATAAAIGNPLLAIVAATGFVLLDLSGRTSASSPRRR